MVSLYPDIVISEGIEALTEAIKETNILSESETTNVLSLADFLLRNNEFEFNGQYFRQISGTAMGTPFAVTYANIYMSFWTRKYWIQTPCQPDIHYRFIDDIWAWSSASSEDIQTFFTCLNTQHPHIKFTMEISQDWVPFLDVKVISDGNSFQTDLFSKETASHRYLPPTSCHPRHVFNSIPYSGALRIPRICSKVEWAEKHLAEFCSYLQSCGYKRNKILKMFEKAKRPPRNELLTYEHKDSVNS